MTKILIGKPVAQKIYESLKIEGHSTMAAILVGEDPASLLYVKVKEKRAQKLGIGFKLFHFSGIANENKILELIKELGENKSINGIIIQLPLPEEIDTDKILRAIPEKKDIDGFSGRFTPPTVQAIIEILNYYHIEINNQKIVIVGFGRLVGQPISKLLKSRRITPIICSSTTRDLAEETIDADILISATGESNLIKPNIVSEKTVVIDAGTAESRGEIAGDVHPKVYEKVAAYTPVPGGVGPVTVAMLLRNTIACAKAMA